MQSSVKWGTIGTICYLVFSAAFPHRTCMLVGQDMANGNICEVPVQEMIDLGWSWGEIGLAGTSRIWIRGVKTRLNWVKPGKSPPTYSAQGGRVREAADINVESGVGDIRCHLDRAGVPQS